MSSSKPLPLGGSHASRGTVVAVDDSPTALRAVVKWLEESAFDVVPLSQSLGATRIIASAKPNVLLLDIKLPGLSGERLASLLSEIPATASVPVIFHSEIHRAELQRLASECAVIGAIAKTNDRNVFMREFEKLAAPFLRNAQECAAAPPSARLVREPQPTGVPEIDEQHKRIQSSLNRLSTLTREAQIAGLGSSAAQELRSVSLDLLVFMRFHLATEHRYLRQSKHWRVQEHRAEQDGYIAQAQAIERALDASAGSSGLVDAARTLRMLALEHIWRNDTAAGPSQRGTFGASR